MTHDDLNAERLALGWHWLATFMSLVLMTSAAAGVVVCWPLAQLGKLIGAIFYFVMLSCLSVVVVEVLAVVWHIFSIREHTQRIAELKREVNE